MLANDCDLETGMVPFMEAKSLLERPKAADKRTVEGLLE